MVPVDFIAFLNNAGWILEADVVEGLDMLFGVHYEYTPERKRSFTFKD
jgi:hypothetical protein